MKILVTVILGLNFSFFSQEVKKIKDLNIFELNDFTEYSVLDSLIFNKRMIFLGESGHSGKEYSQAKYIIIKYLHEKHGFNTIIFESGMADCFYGNNFKNEKDSLWLMTHSIYPIWWAEPVLSLIDYVKKENLIFGGFDFKASSRINSEFIKMIQNVDTVLINQTYRNDLFFSKYMSTTIFDDKLNQTKYDSIKSLSKLLISNYKKLDEIICRQKDDSSSTYMSKIISNKLFELSYFDNQDKIKVLRDSIMSENIKWYFDSQYKNEKIIVWGANDHIAKEKSNYQSHYYAGAILPERIKNESYYIGFYAYSGEMYSYSSGIYKITKPCKKSLEKKLRNYFPNKSDIFIDLSTIHDSKKFNWINKNTISYVWGSVPVNIVPVKFYDGIVLINKLSVAQ